MCVPKHLVVSDSIVISFSTIILGVVLFGPPYPGRIINSWFIFISLQIYFIKTGQRDSKLRQFGFHAQLLIITLKKGKGNISILHNFTIAKQNLCVNNINKEQHRAEDWLWYGTSSELDFIISKWFGRALFS